MDNFTKLPTYSQLSSNSCSIRILLPYKPKGGGRLNFVASGISNAVTEGCNNLVRYSRRISFGIPNFEHMRLRVLVNST